MGVQLSDEEAWAFLAEAHTAHLTTNRKDGWPIALPVWVVVDGRTLYVRKAAASATVRRIHADPRVCLSAETGLSWQELRAVVVLGEASVHSDPATVERVEALLAEKYADYRRPTRVAAAVQRHYERANVAVEVRPVRSFVSWDNRKVRPH